MWETTLKKLCRPVLALALACAIGGFTAAGCIDNSGNKTYPRAEAGADSSDDTGMAADAPATDAPASDAPSVDAGTDSSSTDGSPADHTGDDALADSGTGG